MVVNLDSLLVLQVCECISVSAMLCYEIARMNKTLSCIWSHCRYFNEQVGAKKENGSNKNRNFLSNRFCQRYAAWDPFWGHSRQPVSIPEFRAVPRTRVPRDLFYL